MCVLIGNQRFASNVTALPLQRHERSKRCTKRAIPSAGFMPPWLFHKLGSFLVGLDLPLQPVIILPRQRLGTATLASRARTKHSAVAAGTSWRRSVTYEAHLEQMEQHGNAPLPGVRQF